MTVTEKVGNFHAAIKALIKAQGECCGDISLKKFVDESGVSDAVTGLLVNEEGGLIPSATGLLKRLGAEVHTIKRSDVSGNAVIFVEIDNVRVCIYAAPGFNEAVVSAIGEEKPNFFFSILKKLFG